MAHFFLKGNVYHRLCFDFLCDCLWNFSHPRNNSERWLTPLTSCPNYGSTSEISYPYQHFGLPRPSAFIFRDLATASHVFRRQGAFRGILLSPVCRPHTRISTRTVRRTHSKLTVLQEVSPSTAWSRRTSFIPTSKPLHHQPLPAVPRLVPEGRYDCPIISVSVAEIQTHLTTDNWQNTCRYK